jgi:hypothetical protein
MARIEAQASPTRASRRLSSVRRPTRGASLGRGRLRLAFQRAGQHGGGVLLSQDGRLDLLGLRRRLDAQVLRKEGPQPLVPGQAFSLVPLGVVGQHGQPVRLLGVGIDGHGGPCMVDGGPGVAFGQGGLGRV